MKRRTFLATALAAANASPLLAALRGKRWDEATEVLEHATARKQVDAAVLHVVQRQESFTRHFGTAGSANAMFLLGSISKPMNISAVMSLFDLGKFQLDDRVQKFLPQFKGAGREEVTIRHLLTHVSGLPDQLPENNKLRKRHAPLEEFVEKALRTPLAFKPGTQHQPRTLRKLVIAEYGGGPSHDSTRIHPT
jgi:CubicO group peptidase (beta-lactamase class C family)